MTWDDPMLREVLRGVGAIVGAGLLGLALAASVEWLAEWRFRRARR